MTASNLRLTSFVGNKMFFVNLSDFRQTSSVVWSFNSKGALGSKGQLLNNCKWSLRTNGKPAIPGCTPTDCGVVPRETTSIFTEVSYSVENKEQFTKDLVAHIANLQTLASDLASGFPPTTNVVLIGPVVA